MNVTRPSLHALLLLVAFATLATLGFAAAANGSTLTLKCGGKGPRNKDSSGTVLCAAKPGKARLVEGVVRDDSGHPVSTRVTVTFSKWKPSSGGGYTITRGASRTIGSRANGKFALAVKTATRVSIEFAVGDEAKSVSGAVANAEVSRRLAVKVKKLGGGKVKITVGGLGGKRAKIYVLGEYGYELPGVPPKKANKAGSATFNLHSMRGKFEIYVDVGVWTDLYWFGARPSFRL